MFDMFHFIPGLQRNDDNDGHPADFGKKRNRKEEINVTSRNLEPKSNVSASDVTKMITRRMDSDPPDYEYSDEDYEDKYVLETEKPEPEYYYYYYYDYMDSGIDISHELTTYEPLPSPLPQADIGDGQNTQSETGADSEEQDSK